MSNGFGVAHTRTQQKEVIEKLALIDAMANEYKQHRDFHDFVLRKVAKAGNGAVEQIQAWTSFLESLPYRREDDEILRNPIMTAGVNGKEPTGGDCDDLTVVALAGLRVLGLPCMPEILADQDGNGFHVRAIVGLPATNPTEWRIIDPVWWSERQWATSNWTTSSKPLSPALVPVVTGSAGLSGSALASLQQSNRSNLIWILPLLLLLVLMNRGK